MTMFSVLAKVSSALVLSGRHETEAAAHHIMVRKSCELVEGYHGLLPHKNRSEAVEAWKVHRS